MLHLHHLHDTATPDQGNPQANANANALADTLHHTTRVYPRTLREAYREWPETCLGVEHPLTEADLLAQRRARRAALAEWVNHHLLPWVCAFCMGVVLATLAHQP